MVDNVSEARAVISRTDNHALAKHFEQDGLSEQRLADVLSIVRTKRSHRFFFPLEQYVFKRVFRSEYPALIEQQDLYADGDTYCYDTPKNGQNIAKHGLSFNELMSYVDRGVVIAPIVVDGEKRNAIFWHLPEDIPFLFRLNDESRGGNVLSIAQSVGEKFRLISARVLSSDEKEQARAIRRQVEDVEDLEKSARESFALALMDIVKRNLG